MIYYYNGGAAPMQTHSLRPVRRRMTDWQNEWISLSLSRTTVSARPGTPRVAGYLQPIGCRRLRSATPRCDAPVAFRNLIRLHPGWSPSTASTPTEKRVIEDTPILFSSFFGVCPSVAWLFSGLHKVVRLCSDDSFHLDMWHTLFHLDHLTQVEDHRSKVYGQC